MNELVTKPNRLSEFDPAVTHAFGAQLAQEGLQYKSEPFALRAGGESNWYFDGRRALSRGWMVEMVGCMIVTHCVLLGKDFSVVAGMGIGGLAPASGVSFVSRKPWAIGNEKNAPNDQTYYPRGILGPDIEGKKVLVVDDTASTGDSLFTLIDLIEEGSGIVEDTYTVVDRSHGIVADKMRERGYSFHSLFELSETTGEILPVI